MPAPAITIGLTVSFQFDTDLKRIFQAKALWKRAKSYAKILEFGSGRVNAAQAPLRRRRT
jgi:hypothetical protein